MSCYKLPFLEIDIGVLSIALGASMNPSGDLVDVVQTKSKGRLPWDIFMAPTYKGSSVTYTRDGKVFVNEGRDFVKSEITPTTNCNGRYSCKGIYSSELLNNKSSTLADYKKNGLKAYKLTDDVKANDIDLVTMHYDGRVALQQARRSKKSITGFEITAGTCIYDSREMYLREVSTEECLANANKVE